MHVRSFCGETFFSSSQPRASLPDYRSHADGVRCGRRAAGSDQAFRQLTGASGRCRRPGSKQYLDSSAGLANHCGSALRPNQRHASCAADGWLKRTGAAFCRLGSPSLRRLRPVSRCPGGAGLAANTYCLQARGSLENSQASGLAMGQWRM